MPGLPEEHVTPEELRKVVDRRWSNTPEIALRHLLRRAAAALEAAEARADAWEQAVEHARDQYPEDIWPPLVWEHYGATKPTEVPPDVPDVVKRTVERAGAYMARCTCTNIRAEYERIVETADARP